MLLACALTGSVAGCSTLEGTGDKGYTSGSGRITEIPAADRDEPVRLAGTRLDGADLALESLRGKVVVVNVWGSWCAPCRKEAPLLTAAANELTGEDVAFLGIDIRETSEANAQAFERTFDTPYPSIFDPKGTALLAFDGQIPPNAIPTTLVLDREGRVAARVLGEIPSETTLRNIVEKIVDG